MTDKDTFFPDEIDAALALADGSVFFGCGIGVPGETVGEICFNTAITGYQEILTDPSYAGQIITFTFPHIGNVGTNDEDNEAIYPAARGLILRAPITDPSNFRNQQHLNDWLIKQKLTGICGIDTRALTRHIRLNGAQNVAIGYYEKGKKPNTDSLIKKAKDHPSLKGMELAKNVTCKQTSAWKKGLWTLETSYPTIKTSHYHIVAVDFGCKQNILRHLANRDCSVTVVPATSSAKEILEQNPDGIFLSNGPGDPAATGEYALPMIKEIAASGIPVFGICLGHQLLALSQGCTTEKMHQGHRGANHPVQDIRTGKVEITSQNHGFVVSDSNLPDHVEVTHRSLFDGTVQGISLINAPVFSVQGHPEASPGPHDSAYLFDEFMEMIKEYKNKEAKRA